MPRRFDLSHARVRGTNLNGANLGSADLSYADFSNATFRGANFDGTILKGTILIGADLTDARNFTRHQLDDAITDKTTILPEYLVLELIGLGARAIILAAGTGRRLEFEGARLPKVMLEFGGKTLLRRHLEILHHFRQSALAQRGHITETFNRAIDQLRDEKLEVRLGAIYTLTMIYSQQPLTEYRQPIVEILTAYVRERTSESDVDTPSKDVEEIMNFLRISVTADDTGIGNAA